MEDLANEQIKIKYIRLIRQMVYEWRLEELINLINGKYPSFFMTNQNIFYILTKFKFLKIILFQHDIQNAKDFYSKTLSSIMKKIYGNKSSLYNKKHFKYQYFLKQLDNNDKYILFQQNFKPQIHLDKFINLLEKELLKDQGNERNSIIFNVTKYNINCNIKNNFGKPLFKTEHVNILTYNNENMSEIEEELFKLNLEDTKKSIFNVYSADIKIINKNNIYINNTNSIDIESNSHNNINEELNNHNCRDISNSNICSEINNHKIDSKKFLEKNEFSSFENKEKSNFHNKIRRVNLCKKIVRKFKKFLKLNIKDINYPFWNSFCRENYLPPFKLEDIEFKSYSRIFLNWLFSHEGSIELYNEFIRNKGEEEINKIYINYGINDIEEKKELKNFFINFAMIFSELKNENEIENNNQENHEANENNNLYNNEKSFQADCANTFFDNLNHNKEDNLSIGSINDFYNGERDNNKRGRKAPKFDKILSDSSNSSMENGNYNYNMNDKGYNNEYNKNDYYYNEFSINKNSKYFQNNEKNNNIYPSTFFFGFNNNINASFPNDFFNSDENIRNKIYDNFNED
jgi:hypothetical protein